MKNKRGFTLIELLVVISIISILSTVGLVMYRSAQKSARISKRIQDLHAIATALEIYYQSNGSYPITGVGIWRSECSGYGSYLPKDVIPGLIPGYLVAMPADPSMIKGSNISCYMYRSNDGKDYKIIDDHITEFSQADYQSQSSLIDPDRDGGGDYCIVDGTTFDAWAIWSDGGVCY